MIQINIEIKPRNRFKDFLHNCHSKLEDFMFSILTKLPDRFIPQAVMNWIDKYTTKRMAELQQSIIKDRWKMIALEKAVQEIYDMQQSKDDTPTEE